ncbi:hypothetical protein PR003_g504 [Phytophthora rubi]|uniref:Secreted protein n=1 Tax=Phytophthora rubi TaxID=129364 RepID=A0A6A3NP83_9STRA|nr:hypothetical protein PR002_g2335 [Phytophthora rubi]KAE9359877.1 hypothetical protein PR003_g504 [Phytophthora rubi]
MHFITLACVFLRSSSTRQLEVCTCTTPPLRSVCLEDLLTRISRLHDRIHVYNTPPATIL